MRVVSYRAVFRADHRIYNVGNVDLRQWVPDGVPVLGGIYFIALAVTAAVLYHLPVIGRLLLIPSVILSALFGNLPYHLFAYVGFPFLIAFVAVTRDFNGRQAHRALGSWVGFAARSRSRTRSAGRAVPAVGAVSVTGGGLPTRWDGSDTAALRSGLVTGPAEVRFNVPWSESDEWRAWVARPGDAVPGVLEVRAGRELWVKP